MYNSVTAVEHNRGYGRERPDRVYIKTQQTKIWGGGSNNPGKSSGDCFHRSKLYANFDRDLGRLIGYQAEGGVVLCYQLDRVYPKTIKFNGKSTTSDLIIRTQTTVITRVSNHFPRKGEK